MSVHLMKTDFATSQAEAERRAARIRLCATTPRDSREAGLIGELEAEERRIERCLVVLVVLGLPPLLFALAMRIW
jgi:hypothetical protein